MRKYVILGPQGSGKGTQAKLLARDFDLVHIGVGDILRWHIQSHTKLGARIKRIVASGRLVPDALIHQVVRERLDLHDWNYGFVLDGFPRDEAQALFFLERYDVDAAILLDVADAVVLDRVLARRLCSGCGLDYNLIFHRPAVTVVCDVCGAALVARPEDTKETVKDRLADFHLKLRPILDVFRRKELVITVDAAQPIGDVQSEIRRKLGLRKEREAA